MTNRGLDLDRERREQTGDEWIFGALSQPGLANIPVSSRLTYLPRGEVQKGAEDFSDCVTRGYHNCLEAQFTWLLKNEKISLENEQWLIAKGYVNAGRVEFSDRFTAILSGTTRQGNSMKAPADSIRKNGLIPKSLLPKGENMTFDQYHDRSKITEEMLDLGREFIHRFTINYEQVHRSHIKEANKDDLLAVAVHAWPFPEKGVYPQTSNPLNHCVMLIQPEYEAFDNYTEAANDYTKTLAPDYVFYEYAYRIFISAEKSYTAQISLFQKLIEALTAIVALLSTPKEEKPLPPYIPKPDRYTIWAQAIQAEESSKPPRPTDVNVRLKNPGNLKYTSYTASLGGKKSTVPGLDGGTFCEFDTYQDGLNALKQFLKDAVDGKLRAYKPTQTLLSFTKVYANPPNDGYATNVAKKLGKTIQTPIKDLI